MRLSNGSPDATMEGYNGRMTNGRIALAGILCGLICCAGCAKWVSEKPSSSGSTGGLPPARIADEATVIDVIFWPLPTDDAAGLRRAGSDDPIAAVWERVDEQAIAAETRKGLFGNGLRAGKVRHVEQLLEQYGLPEPDDEADHLLQQVSVASEIAHSRHTIPFRSGEVQDVAIRQTQAGQEPILVRVGKETVGRSLSRPQFLCSLQARPTEDGRVEVRLWPKVEHGDVRQSYVSSDQAIRIDTARDAWTLYELTTEVALDEGETLILTTTPNAFGLGKKMLTSVLPDGSQERVAILVRISRLPQPRL